MVGDQPPKHVEIVAVLRPEVVTEPQRHESRGARDNYRAISDHSDRALARSVDERVFTEALLDPVADTVHVHRMDVDRPVAGAQLNSDRTPVLHDAVSATEQPFHEGVDRRRVDEHIQITMRSGLGTVQSVNGLSAVDLVDD